MLNKVQDNFYRFHFLKLTYFDFLSLNINDYRTNDSKTIPFIRIGFGLQTTFHNCQIFFQLLSDFNHGKCPCYGQKYYIFGDQKMFDFHSEICSYGQRCITYSNRRVLRVCGQRAKYFSSYRCRYFNRKWNPRL